MNLSALFPIFMGMQALSSVTQGFFSMMQANQNAKLAEQQASAIAIAGAAEERKLNRAAQRMKSRQIALAAASGIIPWRGSPLEVQEDTQREFQQDINTVRYNTQLGIMRSQSQANMFRIQGIGSLGLGILQAAGGIAGGMIQSELIKTPPTQQTGIGKNFWNASIDNPIGFPTPFDALQPRIFR